jgi:DNA-binding CsgD family transcriptional regulator
MDRIRPVERRGTELPATDLAHRRLREREVELSAGRTARLTAEGGSGSLLVFTGPVGIGRSALLSAIAHDARQAGSLVLSARCSEAEQDFAFGTVLELFEQYIADVDASELDSLFAGRAGLATPLLTGEGLRDPGALLREAPEASPALTHAVFRVLAHVAAHRPVIVIVDDLHWCDPHSLRFIHYLGARLGGLASSLIVSVRDSSQVADDAVSDLIGIESAQVRRLVPLPAVAIREVINDITGECTARCAVECRWLTGGNPMLVHELIGIAEEGGLGIETHSAAEICASAPNRVKHRILHAFGNLSEDAVAVARAAAVFGSTADRERIEATTELDADRLSRAIDELESAGILDARRPLDYLHPLVRASVYSLIPREQRESLHARAADVLRSWHSEPISIATHLMRTRPGARPWVVEELLRAAGAARRNGELDRAALYLGRALSEPPASEARVDVLLELGRTQMDTGEIGLALGTLQRADELAGEPRPVRVALPLARALCLHGGTLRATAVLSECDPGSVTDRQRDELEATWLTAALIDPRLGPETQRRLEGTSGIEARRAAPELIATAACHVALRGASRLRAMGLADTALDESSGSIEPTVWAPALLALCWSGGFTRARAVAAELAARPATQHSRRAMEAVRVARAHSHHLAGHLKEAEAEARRAAKLVTPDNGTDYLDCPRARLAAILLDRGQLKQAEATLSSATGAPFPDGSIVHAQILAVQARIHAARRRHREALAILTEAGRLLAEAAVENPLVCAWRSQAALATAAIGNRERARELADEEVALASRFGALPAIGVAMTTVGIIATGSEALELLVEAERVLDGSGAELEHARALAYLGATERRYGSPRKARETLTASLDIASGLGSKPIVALAKSELRLAGSRPRSDFASGPEALTDAERRVAELAAQGLTNREIGAELFVTRKTVEWHLRNVFRKLEIETRGEVAAALGAEATVSE